MATRERESARPPFGIAHVTVVPENFEPRRVREDDGARGGGRRTVGERDGRSSRDPAAE